MPQSAEHVLQNPFVFQSNAVSGINSQDPETEMLARPNEEENENVLTRNGSASGGVGLRERRVSRQESRGVNPPPPDQLSLHIPQMPHLPISFLGQRMSSTPAPSPEETDIEGVHLFENFIHEEVRREELHEPENFTPVTAGIPGATGGMNATNTGAEDAFARQGRLLREIADEFARSSERRRVMEQANSVNLANIQQQDLVRLLGELFDDGVGSITFERVVVLFYFCRDLAVRAIRENINSCFVNLMKWSINFIRQRVCHWVQQNGGWEAVLQTIMTRKLLIKAGIVLVTVGAVAAIVGLFLHWQKNA